MAEQILHSQADRSLVSEGKSGLGGTYPWPLDRMKTKKKGE